MSNIRVGVVGARGHTGAELLTLLDHHPYLELALASSRAHDGEAIARHVPGVGTELNFCNVSPAALGERELDALVLALPNNLSQPFVDAWRAAGHAGVVVDLSADHRFDHAWHYGLPELTRERQGDRTHIANPGCYATAMQLALAPIVDLLAHPPVCFGVSGYSGAGTTPSDKNNPALLADNIMPYAPFDHIHEREVSTQLGTRVRFLPHVGSFFRGICMTVAARLTQPLPLGEIKEQYKSRFADEPLVKFSDNTPWVSDNAKRHYACIGGWQVRESTSELVVHATLDNLLKGAATPAIQNLNLACGFDEMEGIPHV